MITRNQYIAELQKLKDINLIKVVTGIRRTGKSTLFRQFQEELKKSGVKQKNIISLNLEEMENEALLDRHILYNYIMSNVNPKQKNYVFIDEIQNVPQFEKLVDSLFVKDYIDLYITGSNAYFLSSELATLLTGRYIEIQMLPFSFSEFSQPYPENKSKYEIFEDYMQYGGFPEASNMLHSTSKDQINNYLSDVFRTIVEKDIMTRNLIRSKFDFERLTEFMLDSVGSYVSPNSIANTMTSNGNKINKETVDNYIRNLTDSFILYKAQRYDIKGKKLLQTINKFYTVDIGIITAILGRNSSINRGHLLENVVYLELLRRYKTVFIGKNSEKEVDFIATDINGEITYYQVALTVRDEKALDRELSALYGIKDFFPKFLITLDPEETVHNGVKQINAVNWLAKNEN
ncbi:MAG: ATP-binding protein [Niabella sp.]